MSFSGNILGMLGRSPLRPLQEHMAKVHASASALLPFFDAVLRRDWNNAETQLNHIATMEGEADNIKRSLRLRLPKSLFLPVPRSALLELLTIQDVLANTAEDIAGIVFGRKMLIPTSLSDLIISLTTHAIDTATQAKKAIDELDELFITGFSGREIELLETMIKKLNTIEHETDTIEVKARQALFKIESELPAVDVVFLYQVIALIGKIADYAQKIGGRLQLLLAR